MPWVEGDFGGKTITTAFKNNGEYNFDNWSNALYGEYSKNTSEVIKLKDYNELANNQVVVSRTLFADAVSRYYSSKTDVWTEALGYAQDLANQVQGGYKNVYNSTNDTYETIILTKDELYSKTNELINLFKKEKKDLTMGIKLFDETGATVVGDLIQVNIVGVRMDSSNYGQNKVLFNDSYAQSLWNSQKETKDGLYISKTNYTKKGAFSTIYLPFTKEEAQINSLYDIYISDKLDDNDTVTNISTTVIMELEMVDSMIKDLSKVFLYLGLALAVFAILLFFNFISVSISYKTREIGILRAVGARSVDVFKIFFSESFVITVICVVLSVIGSAFVCSLLNKTLASSIGVSVFVFGIVSFIILLVIAFATALISTFFPVYKAARKKPVDSIRAL